jgi:predicted signal transduction protein with EAL and GGDEF domain
VTEDSSDALIVHSVVDLGHNLGLTIVAEGVETEQALAALKDYGCDIAQGYYLCRPIPVGAFARWCADSRTPPASPSARNMTTAATASTLQRLVLKNVHPPATTLLRFLG